MLILFLVAALANPPEAESTLYFCKNSKSTTEFTLGYERRGPKIRNVTIVHRDAPRFPPDNRTSWRAEPSDERGDHVRFHFYDAKSGLSAHMDLAPNGERPGNFLLTYFTVVGGGHVFLESETETATCVQEGFQR